MEIAAFKKRRGLGIEGDEPREREREGFFSGAERGLGLGDREV